MSDDDPEAGRQAMHDAVAEVLRARYGSPLTSRVLVVAETVDAAGVRGFELVASPNTTQWDAAGLIRAGAIWADRELWGSLGAGEEETPW